MVEAFACILGRSVFGRTLEVENVRLPVGVQTSGLERVELVIQLKSLLRGDRVLVLERYDVNYGHLEQSSVLQRLS